MMPAPFTLPVFDGHNDTLVALHCPGPDGDTLLPRAERSRAH